jgi:hypothetical protein
MLGGAVTAILTFDCRIKHFFIGFLNNFTPKLPAIKVRFNLLKLTGYMVHLQFNIQQLYTLPTLYLRVLYLFQNKRRLVPLAS